MQVQIIEMVGKLGGSTGSEEDAKILSELLKMSQKSANSSIMVERGVVAPLVALLQQGPQQNRASSAGILMNLATNKDRQV